jgi:hypothetical protein
MYCWKSNVTQKTLAKFVATAVLITLVIACKPVENTGEQYYNIDSLLQAQTQLLISTKASLTKSAGLGDARETKQFSPDSMGWVEEFGTLSELALINKPIYRGMYAVSDERDSKSNLRVLSYSIKENDKESKVPVRKVRIYYLGTLDRVKRIEGVYNEENELYQGSHQLSIELQDIYNKTMITSYSIVGHQKMILADSVDFTIEGKIGIN